MHICDNDKVEINWGKFENTFKWDSLRYAWTENEGSIGAFSLHGRGKVKQYVLKVSKVSAYSILS